MSTQWSIWIPLQMLCRWCGCNGRNDGEDGGAYRRCIRQELYTNLEPFVPSLDGSRILGNHDRGRARILEGWKDVNPDRPKRRQAVNFCSHTLTRWAAGCGLQLSGLGLLMHTLRWCGSDGERGISRALGGLLCSHQMANCWPSTSTGRYGSTKHQIGARSAKLWKEDEWQKSFSPDGSLLA